MGRGFLSGIFWGAIVGVALIFVSSQALDRQQMSLPQPQAGTVEVPGGSEFDQARAESDPVLPQPESIPEAEPAQGIALPEEETDAPPAMDTSALEVPVPSVTEEASGLGEAPEAEGGIAPAAPEAESAVASAASAPLAEPETPAAAPEAVSTPEEPVAVAEPAPTPETVPTEEPAPEAETQVATLPETDTPVEQPTADPAPEISFVGDAPSEPTAPDVSEETSLPGAPAAPEQPPLPEVTEPAAEPAPEAPAPEVAEAPPADVVEAPEPEAPQPEIAEAPAPEVAEAPAAAEPEIEVAEAAPEPETGASSIRVDGGPSLLKPVENLPSDGTAATDNGTSLPGVLRIGDDPAPAAEPETAEAADPEDAAEDPSDQPALQAYGTPFENPDGRPVVAIVLVHTGEGMLDLARLASLPPNVSFAIDASRPDATDLARAYRAAGREIVMIPALPENARPQDIEQALQVNFDRVPEAVALMDGAGSTFQTDRNAVSQVVAVAGATGHGLITFPRGLNPAYQEAERAGVPAGLVLRDIDGAGEDQEQIGRALDRAAFRARQDDAAILVGTTREQTLAALIEWSLGSRAQGVAIAPISAALLGG